MRLTPPLLTTSEVRYSPLGLRQLILRNLSIPTVENLAVTLDQFDSFDLTSNQISALDNLPTLNRLSELLLANNSVDQITPTIGTKLPSLDTLVLANNELKTLSSLLPLFSCAKLTTLVLTGNAVTTRPHYRLLLISRIPTLKVLDYIKVSQKEKDTAARFAKSKAYEALVKDVYIGAGASADEVPEASGVTSAEFDAPASAAAIKTTFTEAERKIIKQAIADASSPAEIDAIHGYVSRGVMPPSAKLAAPSAAPASAPAAAPKASPAKAAVAPKAKESPVKEVSKRKRSDASDTSDTMREKRTRADSTASAASTGSKKNGRKESNASASSSAGTNYGKMTVAALKAEIGKRGLEVPKGVKAVLVEFLEKDDAK